MGTVIGVAKSGDTNSVLAVLVVVLPIIGALFGAVLGRWSDAADKRREHYADAVRILVRWSEYPYRIRRRTSDASEELARLAELGHELQEQLQCHRTWVRAESARVGRLYERAIATLKERAGPSIAEAWLAEPVASGAGMVLNGWGPGSIDDLLAELDDAIAWRFGWRRLVPKR